MTAYTRTEVVNRLFQMSSLAAAEETPSAADFALGSVVLSDVLDTLSAVGVTVWNGSIDSLPSEYMVPLCSYGGLFMRYAFGGPAPEEGELLSGERLLRRISAKPATGSVADGNYF